MDGSTGRRPWWGPRGKPRRNEAIVTPSSGNPPGMLQPPGAEAFPPSAPHTVPAYARTRWTAGMARWWRALFTRDAYARGPATVRSGRRGHRFFQHLIDPADEDVNDASSRDDAGMK
jgi:hypothetical protein